MNREELGASLRKAIPVEETVVHVLVPESKLVALVLAARNAVFDIDESALSPAVMRLLIELDRASEPLADLLGVDDFRARYFSLVLAAEKVQSWIDGGCVTFPPLQHIRALVESLI